MSIKIALAGNPNSGKTTLFNSLTGSNQYVGNWPGVTVEKKEGRLRGHRDIVIQDLPGVYSLSPYTLEEVVSRNYLVEEKPDVILNIVDGTNLERNLYLTTQLAEVGVPMVIALNMCDLLQKRGESVDLEKLSREFGCPVVEISALKGTGTKEAAEAAVRMAGTGRPAQHLLFAPEIEDALKIIAGRIRGKVEEEHLRWYAVKLFERDAKAMEKISAASEPDAEITSAIEACEKKLDDDSESIITDQRYQKIGKMLAGGTRKKVQGQLSVSDKIDRIVTNRWLALPIFAIVMFLVYYVSVSTVGDILTGFTNDTLFGEWIAEPVREWLAAIGTQGWLVGLVVDGVIGGVGAVLGFVPQMLVLFLFLAVLEDCGYMARIAFIMDRLFRKFGFSGKSFIPMLIGSGCSVPGIMASRTIENDRDRKMTIMTTSFVPCGAKMPIVALLAGAVFGGAWWIAPSAYFIGIVAVVCSGILLKKTRLFAGEPSPFVMELPAYHLPTVGGVLRSTWERGWSFIKKAGLIILPSSILIWLLSSFGIVGGGLVMVEDMDLSLLANLGNLFAFLFIPLGFGNWQSSVATVMGLVAKEEVVSVFGTLYGVAGDALEFVENGAFGELGAIAGHFTGLSAYSFLIFNLLCAPCFAAIGAIRREMNSAKWTWATVGYQTGLAYSAALIVYQLGQFFTGAGFTVWTAVAFVLLGLFFYLLLRPAPKNKVLYQEVRT